MENIINELTDNSFFIPRDNKDNKNVYNFYDEKSDPNRWVGMCYVPVQEWEQVYDEDTAFSAGTLFPSLNKPFWGGGK
ncbi:MAG: spore coat associated protein CotJA [Oscillospiraceae bacterium]|nr:spore coat associated protein CotJA [Oscillospiraceae bacterium]